MKTRRPADLALHLLLHLIGFYLNFFFNLLDILAVHQGCQSFGIYGTLLYWCYFVCCVCYFIYFSQFFVLICLITSPTHLLSMSSSVDEAVVEEPQLDQNHSSGPGAEFQSAPDHLDQEQQQDRPEVEEELLDLDLEDKPPHQQKQKVSCNFRTQDFWSEYIIKIAAFFLVGITLV